MSAILARRQFYLVDRVIRTRREVEQRAPLVSVVRSTPRAVLVTDGNAEAWVPLSALNNTSEPDVLALSRWYRPKESAKQLFRLRDASARRSSDTECQATGAPQPRKFQ